MMGNMNNLNYNFSLQTKTQKNKEAEIEEAKNGSSPDPVIYEEEYDY